jgi:hypothetical protein
LKVAAWFAQEPIMMIPNGYLAAHRPWMDVRLPPLMLCRSKMIRVAAVTQHPSLAAVLVKGSHTMNLSNFLAGYRL